MMNRSRRAEIAQETIDILTKQSYTTKPWESNDAVELDSDPVSVDLAASLQAACDGTVFHPVGQVLSSSAKRGATTATTTQVHVCNDTTFGCARRLAERSVDVGHLAALNFASAMHPGGGFLRGALAQEEALAATSGLYACLTTDAAAPFYEYHHNQHRARNKDSIKLYSSNMIFSPHVTVFRDSQINPQARTLPLLSVPYTCSIITSCAVNQSVPHNGPQKNKVRPSHETQQATREMQLRAHRVLQVAVHHGVDSLILGAWGCGVFGNSPQDIARAFAMALRQADVQGRIPHVYFAIPGSTEDNKYWSFVHAFRHSSTATADR